MNKSQLTSALMAAFSTVKEVIGTLKLAPDYSAQAVALAETLEHLRIVDKEIPIALLREADLAQAEYRKDHGLPAPDLNPLPSDLDGPVRMEPRPAKMNFKMERHLAEHVWDFCQRHNCKPGQYFRLLAEKDMRLAASGTAKVQ